MSEKKEPEKEGKPLNIGALTLLGMLGGGALSRGVGKKMINRTGGKLTDEEAAIARMLDQENEIIQTLMEKKGLSARDAMDVFDEKRRMLALQDKVNKQATADVISSFAMPLGAAAGGTFGFAAENSDHPATYILGLTGAMASPPIGKYIKKKMKPSSLPSDVGSIDGYYTQKAYDALPTILTGATMTGLGAGAGYAIDEYENPFS